MKGETFEISSSIMTDEFGYKAQFLIFSRSMTLMLECSVTKNTCLERLSKGPITPVNYSTIAFARTNY